MSKVRKVFGIFRDMLIQIVGLSITEEAPIAIPATP
jgi:hypothetical protein